MLSAARGRPVTLLVLLAGVVAGVSTRWWTFLDLTVYRYGGQTVLDHQPLYAAGEPHSGLLFTYPPVAGLAFTALARVPIGVATALITAAGVVALAGTLQAVARERGWRPSPLLVAGLTLAALALDPVRETLLFGQVNLLLMGLVTYDLLVLRGRCSGVLVGLAAGIKLTPLVFVVLLVVVGRRAAACRAVSTFAATVLVGVVLLPSDAATYWTRALWDHDRVGGTEYIRNQALTGVLTRLAGHEPATWLWLLVAGSVGAAALAVAGWWWRRGARDVGLLVAAGAMLLCSPISWDHHWVWLAPLLVVLTGRLPRWVTGAVAVLTLVGLRPLVEHGERSELTWRPLQQLPGNGYTWLALALLAVAAASAACTEVRQRRARTSSALPSRPAEPSRAVAGPPGRPLRR